MKRKTGYNSTFAIGGVSCSEDSLVVDESFVLRIKFSGKNPAHRKSANRCTTFYEKTHQNRIFNNRNNLSIIRVVLFLHILVNNFCCNTICCGYNLHFNLKKEVVFKNHLLTSNVYCFWNYNQRFIF